jgi:RNA polymerase sigma-70 factor (ECF subfamily)
VVARDAVARLEDALETNQYDILRYFERRMATEDAADALGDLMLTAWRRVDTLPVDVEQARMWLFGIARLVQSNSARGDQRRHRLTDRLRTALVAAGQHTAAADHGLEVRDAISRLEPDQGELIRLVHWEGFAIADAAAILDIPASTARSRYQRARSDLAEAFSSHDTARSHL